MSKYWIEYFDNYTPSPLSSDVHRPLDCEYWGGASKYDPPLPKPIIGKGFQVFKIEVKGHILKFSSIEEIDHCIEVFSNKVLPTTYQISHNSWVKGAQHTHWLSKFPGQLKSFKNRLDIVKLLKKLKTHNKFKNVNASKAGSDAAKTRRPF